MQAVILAGGLGTRMSARTTDRPKALIEVRGRPFLDHQLELLRDAGIREAVFSIGYRGSMIREFVGDGSRWGLKAEFVDEGAVLLGTAGALRKALDEGVLQERFFVLYGDSYLPIDYGAVWKAYEGAGGAQALMTFLKNEGRWDTSNVAPIGARILYRKGLPGLEWRGRYHAFDCIDYGVSVLARDWIARNTVSGLKADLAALFGEASEAGELAGFEVHERFYEIGSESGLADFEAYLDQKEGA